MSASTLFFSLFGGILPALLWLWFWLKEDRLHPEPRALLVLSFAYGMLVVLPAIWLEKLVWDAGAITGIVIIAWSVIEEVCKYLASYFSALRKNDNNEPIDSLIYLITTALGFAALENTFFLVSALKGGDWARGLDLTVLRFVGATLLHVVSSGALGFFLALGFGKLGIVKKLDWLFGLIAAISLHALFNFYILKASGNGAFTFGVFAGVWLAITLLLIGFEKIKHLKA